MSTLVVAMIVRDEQQMLPGCLQSLAALPAHTVVAADTGSTDGTRRLLTEHGAVVYDFSWCDDFSAARNAVLEKCRADWVLVLDADERVSAELGRQIAELIERDDAGAATVLMSNVQANGHVREARLLRLFRRDDAVRFQYPIHEDVSESVMAYLHRTGKSLEQLDGRVEHLGYQKDYAAARGKKERDQRLLQKHLSADPTNLYSHFKLLELARFYKDGPLSVKAAFDAASALEVAKVEALQRAPWAGELVVLVANAKFERSPKQALAFIESFEGKVMVSAAWQLRRAELNEQLGRFDVARVLFSGCTSLRGQLGDLQLSTVRPCMGLARLALAQNKLDESLHWAKTALEMAPQDPEAKLAVQLIGQQLAKPVSVIAHRHSS